MRLLRCSTCLLLALLILGSAAPTCTWDYLVWIPRSPEADALYRFIRDGKAGYIDQKGVIVISPVIEWYGGNNGGEFRNGLLEVGASDGIYVDRSGNQVINKKFYRGWDFSEGLAVAMETEGGKWGFIDKTGNFVIPPQFASSTRDYVSSFEGGFAEIEVAGKFGYIDHTGKFAIPPTLLDGDSFHNGYARVVVEGPCVIMESLPCSSPRTVPPGAVSESATPRCKYTFVDSTGRLISDLRFDSALPFSDGLAPVQMGKLWGYLDTSGQLVISPKFEKAEPFSNDLGLVRSNGLYGYIDRSGIFVIPAKFNRAENFADGLALIGDEETQYSYIDTSGKQAFPGRFIQASSYFKGLAHVKLQETSSGEDIREETFAYINTDGQRVFTYTYKLD
jgi:hypothetical protein